MKKIMVLAVAAVFAFALAANAEEKVEVKEKVKKDGTTKMEVKAVDKEAGTKEKIKVTEKKDGEVKIKATEKDKVAGTKETLKVKEDGTTVKGKDVVKHKQGKVVTDTVKFEKYEANGDYIYVVKEDKVVRMKHKLSDNMKKDMLKLKKGDKVTITSTYEMTPDEVAVVTGLTAAPAANADQKK